MNQNNELARVKARIKALSQKTVSNGCSEAEAMAAADMVGHLLYVYDLTMEEVDIRDERSIVKIIETGSKRRATPMYKVFSAMCEFCDTVWYFSTTEWKPVIYKTRRGDLRQKTIAGNVNYAVFGHEHDVDMVIYLYKIVDRAMKTETLRFKTTHQYARSWDKRDATRSFQCGMAIRIAERLREMRAKRMADLESADASKTLTRTALVVLKDQLVRSEFEDFSRREGLIDVHTVVNFNDDDAADEGRRVAEDIRLDRPLEAPRASVALLETRR